MLRKEHLELTRFADRESCTSPDLGLGGVCITKNAAVATDGRRLVTVSIPADEGGHETGLILDADLCKAGSKLLKPRSTMDQTVTVESAGNHSVVMKATTASVTGDTIDAQYPQYEAVIPDHEKDRPTAQVVLSAAQLESVCGYIRQFGAHKHGELPGLVKIRVWMEPEAERSTKAVRFDADLASGLKLTAIIMPAVERMD